MPLTVRLSDSSAGPGEQVRIAIHSTSAGNVRISCFFDEPPPGGFGPCAQCGVRLIATGHNELLFRVSADEWRGRRGKVLFEVSNRDGDKQQAAFGVDGLPLTMG